MTHRFHVFPDLIIMGITLLIQIFLSSRVWARPGWQSRTRRLALIGGNLAMAALLVMSFLSSFHRVHKYMPNAFAQWLEACGLIVAAGMLGLYLAVLIYEQAPKFQPPRRTFLQAASASMAIAPFVGVPFAILNRHNIRLSEAKVRIPNLPKDLEGLRLVQVTDIHLGPFFSEKELAWAIDMANETRAHLAFVTGDLISRLGDPLDACLRQVVRLRAEAGVLGCLGNHEVYTATEDYVTEQAKLSGIEFLRSQARLFRFGKASINFAGVDYQDFKKPYLVGTENLLAPDSINVLLSHNPDVFPVAARQGYELTLGGHTHGGQVNFEILHQNVNPALYFTRFVRGLYERDGKSVYVCSGLGTIGVPVRLGAPAEISLIHLSA
jgi:predicted MPP superfamily phosphohydrolase